MKKVLVVDDSKTIRTLCEWIYKGLEDRLFTADSAASARQVIQSESPDVVIVDYTLPDMDSYEFVSSICNQTHVVMMGGTYANFSEDKAKSSGAVAVIMKPFKTAEFFEKVETAAGVVAPTASAESPSVAVPPEIPPRRFNFPSSPSVPVVELSRVEVGTPTASVVSISQTAPAVSRESATPRTPVPSISPEVQAARAQQNIAPETVVPQIDPALIRAEVIAAVKALLPGYLKKIIQAEVRPQLQNWVDSRVEALINKYLGR